jgi:hypothetical protein
MALERKNPLPPGVYWIDVIGKHQSDAWWEWIGQNKSVKVLKRVDRGYHDVWHLFEVTDPVPRWPTEALLGLPTIATSGDKTTEKSTVQRPAVQTTSELVDSWTAGLGKGIGQTILILGLFYLITNRKG